MDEFSDRVRRAKAGSGYKVKVGLPKGTGSYPDGTPVILVGIVHEFGTADGTIPERSFLRSAMTKHIREHRKLGRDLARTVTLGTRKPEIALGLLGARAAANVKQMIVILSQPPNTAATIARKGSSNPLVDTGLLGQSITWEVLRPGE